MKRIITVMLCSLLNLVAFSQTPTGFSYQAVLRNSNGEVLAGQSGQLRIILTSSDGTVTHYQEVHSISTGTQGIVNIVIGDGLEKVGTLADVPWGQNQIHLKLAVKMGSATTFTEMGSQPLQAVPYALHAGNKEVVSNPAAGDDEPIFVVRNRLGQIVFAVYQEGVRVYVDDGTTPIKGTKGGFAVGGLSGIKEPVEYFRITADSARIYVKEQPSIKGAKGGFAVGGLSGIKATREFFSINSDSARIYIDDTGKGLKGGFAVGGLSGVKSNLEYLRITPDSARVYIKDQTKGAKGGFAVGGLSGIKVTPTQFLNLTPENYFIGHESGQNIQAEGLYNSTLGYQAGRALTIGRENIFIGYQSGIWNTEGSWNTFIGYQAGAQNTTGSNNVLLGYRAGKNYTSGAYNTFIGYEAGIASATNFGTADNNVGIGYKVGSNLTSGNDNIMIGREAGLKISTGSDNTLIGQWAGIDLTTGVNNVAIGYYSGRMLGANANNTLVGKMAGERLTTGGDNTFYGAYSGQTVAGGMQNTYIGYDCGLSNLNGRNNTYLGYRAGRQSQGDSCVFIGSGAGMSESASNKLYIANNSTSPLIWGDFKTKELGLNCSVRINTTLNQAILNVEQWQGVVAMFNRRKDDGDIVIFYHGDAGLGNPKVGSISVSGSTISYNTTSDRRLKYNIVDSKYGLQDVLRIKSRDFIFKDDISKKVKTGFIAQELYEVFPDAVTIPEKEDGIWQVDYGKVTPMLVKAIQDQQLQINTLKEENSSLKAQIKEIETLKAELEAIKTMLKK